MTVPGRITNLRGRFWQIPLARYLCGRETGQDGDCPSLPTASPLKVRGDRGVMK